MTKPEGRSLSEIIAKNLAFWQEAIQRIGFEATFLVLNNRKHSPSQAEKTLELLNSLEAVIKYIRECPIALF